jgi:hypothetical protein
VFLARYALRNSVGADGSIHETVGMRQSGAGIISKYVEESGVVLGVITKSLIPYVIDVILAWRFWFQAGSNSIITSYSLLVANTLVELLTLSSLMHTEF